MSGSGSGNVGEVRVPIDPRAADIAETLLLEGGSGAWSIVEEVDNARVSLVGIFPSREAARAAWGRLEPEMAAAGVQPRGEPVFRGLAEAEWRDSYKAHFKAWTFGQLHWVPIWEEVGYQLPEGHAVLWLDPGLAFGTGNHETTRLCVERLAAIAMDRGMAPITGEEGTTAGMRIQRRSGGGCRVVDAGCGSGILALSAVLLGFSEVIGFDDDPEAIRVSEENAVSNGLAQGVRFFVGDLTVGLAGMQTDVLLANIQADVLMKHASELVGAILPGGSLVLSGILAGENSQVREVFEKLTPGWAVNARTMGDWSDVLLVRPAEW